MIPKCELEVNDADYMGLAGVISMLSMHASTGGVRSEGRLNDHMALSLSVKVRQAVNRTSGEVKPAPASQLALEERR